MLHPTQELLLPSADHVPQPVGPPSPDMPVPCVPSWPGPLAAFGPRPALPLLQVRVRSALWGCTFCVLVLSSGLCRALSFSTDCITGLGMEGGAIADSQISASSQYLGFLGLQRWAPELARLRRTGIVNAWTASNYDRKPWIQVRRGCAWLGWWEELCEKNVPGGGEWGQGSRSADESAQDEAFGGAPPGCGVQGASGPGSQRRGAVLLAWVQVNLLRKMRVTGVVTQGASRASIAEYVKTFKVAYSLDGRKFHFIQDEEGSGDKVRLVGAPERD